MATKKGLFTGALSEHKGYFEAAEGGTLFLDEVGDLPLEAQTKLLRVLEDQQVTRVGSTRPTAVNVRLLAATNTDLEAAVQGRRFRQDLFYRLNVLRLSLPPLRNRREDIPLLVRIFLDRFARENSVPPKTVAPQVLAQMQAYQWPGNVRELKNLTERLAVMAPGPNIEVGDLPPELKTLSPPNGDAALNEAAVDAFTGLPLEKIEAAVITRTLDHTEGNRAQAAQLLGISLRTLQRKLKAYGKDDGSA